MTVPIYLRGKISSFKMQHVTANEIKPIKIMILGSTSVGKTSILARYVNNKFADNYNATLAFDFVNTSRVIGENTMCLDIWDTVGQERYRSMAALYFRGASACVLVFDITNRDTFFDLDGWLSFLMSQLPESKADSFPLAVLGNKADLSNHGVKEEEVKAWCAKNGGFPYYEASAKNGEGINAAFEYVAKKASKMMEIKE